MRAAIARTTAVLALGVLAGCGESGDPAADPEQGGSVTPTGESSLKAERRAERQQRNAERCRELLSDVTLTYRITTEPAAEGSEIGLHMTLANRSEARLTGSTTGVLQVSPGPRSNRISWGGSSADELWQRPGTTTTREVWHERQPPGWHPVGTRVTAFHFDTYTYAPGPGVLVCHIPATVVAPPGLVEGQPSGRWTQEPSG